jgi:hypothetical protein
MYYLAMHLSLTVSGRLVSSAWVLIAFGLASACVSDVAPNPGPEADAGPASSSGNSSTGSSSGNSSSGNSSSGNSSSGNSSSGNSSTGSSSGGRDATTLPGPDCSGDLSPACVRDGNGFFVNGAAPAGGTGTKALPFKTLQAAVEATAPSSASKNIFICAGKYPEALNLSGTIRFYGGFLCSDFSHLKDANAGTELAAPTVVIAPPRTIGLKIGVGSDIAMQDLKIQAQPAAADGESSIGVFAQRAKVALTRLVIEAGAGKAGAQPAAPVSNWSPAMNKQSFGRVGGSAMCVDGTSSTGGDGGKDGVLPTSGTSTPAVSMPAVNLSTNFNPAGVGAPGTPGAASPADTAMGMLTEAGFALPVSSGGQTGKPGQGGGGQLSGIVGVQQGNGGGAGGCGGSGGRGSQAGGSSIAVLSFQVDQFNLTACILRSGNGGTGGVGGSGESGDAGGLGFAPGGGRGGPGAGGSGGNGGYGGFSVGVMHKGSLPTRSGGKTLLGALGAGGMGGTGGPIVVSSPGGAPGTNGVPGKAQEEILVP